MTTVYASAGRRYHSSPHCRALARGQDQWDWDCPDDYCSHQHHGHPRPIAEMTTTAAVASGKTPCLSCKPPLLNGPQPWHNFGHTPITGILDGRALGRACARCTQRTRFGTVSVRWPCATERVLKLDNPWAGR